MEEKNTTTTTLTYHIRKKIKEEIKNNLKTIPIFNDSNIFFDSAENVDESTKMPIIFVNSISESIEVGNISGMTSKFGRTLNRTYSISIIAFLKSNNFLNDKLDALNFDIENCMSSTKQKLTLNDTVKYTNLTNVDFQFFEDLEKKTGCVKLDYDIVYSTNESDVSKSV